LVRGFYYGFCCSAAFVVVVAWVLNKHTHMHTLIRLIFSTNFEAKRKVFFMKYIFKILAPAYASPFALLHLPLPFPFFRSIFVRVFVLACFF